MKKVKIPLKEYGLLWDTVCSAAMVLAATDVLRASDVAGQKLFLAHDLWRNKSDAEKQVAQDGLNEILG